MVLADKTVAMPGQDAINKMFLYPRESVGMNQGRAVIDAIWNQHGFVVYSYHKIAYSMWTYRQHRNRN
jgi:hypothetical protein